MQPHASYSNLTLQQDAAPWTCRLLGDIVVMFTSASNPSSMFGLCGCSFKHHCSPSPTNVAVVSELVHLCHRAHCAATEQQHLTLCNGNRLYMCAHMLSLISEVE